MNRKWIVFGIGLVAASLAIPKCVTHCLGSTPRRRALNESVTCCNQPSPRRCGPMTARHAGGRRPATSLVSA
jgi:hypothetical protein